MIDRMGNAALVWYDATCSHNGITRDEFHLFVLGLLQEAQAAERERWKKADGYVFVIHPDDPMLRELDGQLVFVQRTIPRSSVEVSSGRKEN